MTFDQALALALALEVLRQYRPLLESLAQGLEARGFVLERDLALALAPVAGIDADRHLPPGRAGGAER